MGHGEHLGAAAGLPHRRDLVQVDAVVVLALGIGALVGNPVHGLQQLAGIGPERRRSGRGLLALALLRGGLRGLPCRFLLRRPGRELRLRIRSQALAVAHDGHFLRLRVPAPHDALPLRVERVIRHVLIRADGEDDVAPGGHLAEQTAHFQVVVRAGAVGIQEHGDLPVLVDILLEVFRAVNRMRGQGGVLHGHGFPGAGSAPFDHLFLFRLREADRARGEHRRRQGHESVVSHIFICYVLKYAIVKAAAPVRRTTRPNRRP